MAINIRSRCKSHCTISTSKSLMSSSAAPDLDNNTESNAFYLKLKDDFGHEEKSPKFTVSGTQVYLLVIDLN